MNRRTMLSSTAALAATLALPAPALARTAAQIAEQGRHALAELTARQPRARFYADHAVAVLVIPSIIKAGLVWGGESGNGVLLSGGRVDGFYNLSGGSFGLQAGAEKFALALFFMNAGALRYLHKSGGFALGTGPSLAFADKGAGAEASSSTIVKDIYAIPFNQAGLMADLTLQGTKISVIHPH
jgi:lipid-binding SYLF domain-containing protein